MEAIIFIQALVIGISIGRLVFLNSRRLLKRRHTNMIFLNFMIALTVICFLKSSFIYLYGQQCPWTVDLEKADNLLWAAKTLLDTIIQAFIVFMTLGVAYGYDILYADVSQRILKFVFGLTISKFFFMQMERGLSGVEAFCALH